MRQFYRALPLWGVAGIFLVCVSASGQPAQAGVDLGKFAAAGPGPAFVDSDVRIAVMQLAAKAADTAEERAAIRNLFGCTNHRPLWSTASGPRPVAAALIGELRRADDWGLAAKDFEVPASLPENPSSEARAAYEVALSAAALKYTRFAHGGRIPDPPAQLASYLDRRPARPDPENVLLELATTTAPDAYLRDQHPRQPQFALLRQQLLAMRDHDADTIIIPPGPALRPGMTHDQVALLRKRLGVPVQAVEGVTYAAEFYDGALAAVVKSFQREKGLSANGTVGRATRRELNEGMQKADPDSIVANMEMWRWMPDDLGDFHVEVNVPEFTVRVVDRGRVVHSERVVAGRKETQTPIFSDRLSSVVFQPQWGLPDSIKVNEVLPRLLRGDGLRAGFKMQRNGRDIDPYNVNWNRANILDYTVFQPSGDDNALGQVKFLFPNKHQVYMHDTPSKGLFNEKVRTFSHGCVRVRNPVRLAEIVLAEDKGWDTRRVRTELEDKDENNKVALDRKVPVHITYFTAAVDEHGKLETFKDIYGHENRVTLALKGRWNDIPKLPDHLAPVKVEQTAQSARRTRNDVAADDDDTSRQRRTRFVRVERTARVEEALRAPPVRYYAAGGPAPSYYGGRSSLGHPVSRRQPKSFFQQLFGGN